MRRHFSILHIVLICLVALVVYAGFELFSKSIEYDGERGSGVPVVFAAHEPLIVPLDFPRAEDGVAFDSGPVTSRVSIIGPRGQEFTEQLHMSLEQLETGEYALAIDRKNQVQFEPGKYHVSAHVETVDGFVAVEQDFMWGVLAVNTNKSIYSPGEVAELALAVLDEEGDMVCDAEVVLTITNPSGDDTILKTDDGTVIVNEECQLKEVTYRPDYEAVYSVDGVGVYQMELSATTQNGTYSIRDFFEVRDDVVFDVERITATRIYPVHPYEVTMHIAVAQDFVGEIREVVPRTFDITPHSTLGQYDRIEQVGDRKILIWDVEVPQDTSFQIGYTYKSPDVSPEFFLLGPLQFTSGKQLLFEEIRQWQIAVDAIAFDATTNSGNQTNTSSFNWSHTVTTGGDNRILIVGVTMFDTTDSDRTVTGITYNSVAMTNVREDDNDTDNVSTSLWYLLDPSTGSNTVSVTLNGSNQGAIGGAMSFTGVDQAAPEANAGDTTASGTSLSTSITTVADNAWVVDVVGHFNSDTDGITVGGSQTESWNVASGSQRDGAGSRRGPVTPAGSTSMAWSGGSNAEWVHSLASLAPAISNTIPTVSEISDNPDPLTAGEIVSFDIFWSDSDGDQAKVKVCKTDSLTNMVCDGGHWATSTAYISESPEVVTYTTTGSDVATNNYFVFVCDTNEGCSSSSSGSFTVQTSASPTISSVTDTPDPTNPGRSVTFLVDWADTNDNEKVKAKVCQTNSLTNQVCDGGAWASSTSFSVRDPLDDVIYDVVGGDAGQTRNYWVFVCDDLGSCSSSTSGSFTVNGTSVVPNVIFR